MADVHKKHEPSSAKASTDAKAMADKTEGQGEKTEEKKSEPMVISDTVTETTERIEVIEEVSLDEPKEDPLMSFKEKMSEEESLPSDMPAKKNFMWPILFIFIIALLMLGGIFAYKNNTKSEKVNVVTLSPTPIVMPEPTKAIDLSKYSIKILNGSGVAGEAGRQKTNLETEGFTVSSAGNADNSDYKSTIIKAKEKVDKAFLDKLKSVLGSTFTLGEIETLSDDTATPVVIIVGTKK